jgi:hypothetical protein
VIGEGLFEAATSRADSNLQSFNDTLLAIATEQAGDAAKSAKIARDEAEAAEGAAGKGQQKAEAVAKRADELNRNLQTAKTELED